MNRSATSARQLPFGTRSILNESRLLREPIRLALHLPRLMRRTRCPVPIIVLPGLGGADASTIALRCYLQGVGHHVQGWQLGTHQRHVLTTLQRFSRRLHTAVEAAGQPITLIGWSLGGVIAREAARDRPDHVAQVITMGSPINGPRHTSIPRLYDTKATANLDRLISYRKRRPIGVPVTAIHSRRDGIVNWRHAIDHDTPTAVNIEVTSSHLGLGLDPDVWKIIVDTLEHPPQTAPPPAATAPCTP